MRKVVSDGMDRLLSLISRFPILWRQDNDPTLSIHNTKRLLAMMIHLAELDRAYWIETIRQEISDMIEFVDKFLIPYQRQCERRRVRKRYK
jgi:hypothetical protein